MDITFGDYVIAKIEQAPKGKPTAQRGFDVVSLLVPLELELKGSEPGTAWVLSGLIADLSSPGSAQDSRLLG